MKAHVRQMMKKIPGGAALLKALLSTRRSARRWLLLRPHKTAESLFTHYYNKRIWKGGGQETVSGAGSTLEYTANIRKELPPLLERLQVTTMLDAPCGDFNWFRQMARPEGMQYIGGDIVRPLVDRNTELYANATTTFRYLDITQGPLPAVDLWLCRDCLFHLPTQSALEAIDNFLKSNIPYLLTTHHPRCNENTDIPTGLFRQINLELPPYSFPPARFYMDDWIEGYPVRSLGLWHRDDLVRAFGASSVNQPASAV